MEYRDRSLILRVFGALLLLGGVACAILGPVEMYCYYLFSEGGPFYYEGFGFGSFMFANLTAQIAGYYVIALILIPLGYGHVTLRRWARPVAEALLWCWLVLGLPLTLIFFGILFSAKDLGLPLALAALLLLPLAYPVAPILLLRFYRGDNIRRTFEARDPERTWLNRLPTANLVLSLLFLFYLFALHLPIFLNGMFPAFGTWLTGLPGIIATTAAILSLAVLVWGVLRQSQWAWWGSILYFALLTSTIVVAFATTSYFELLSTANFPQFEVDFLDGIPLQGIHLALFFGIPLLATWCVVLASKRGFGVHQGAAKNHGGSPSPSLT